MTTTTRRQAEAARLPVAVEGHEAVLLARDACEMRAGAPASVLEEEGNVR